VVDFARGENATLIVVGVSTRSRWREVFIDSTGTQIARLAGANDVHLVTHERARAGRVRRPRSSALSARRRVAGWVLAVAGPVALVALLAPSRGHLLLSTDLMAFTALAVTVALVGGLWPAVVSAVLGFLLLNWFFIAPTGRLTIAEPENALALGAFVLVAAGVASVVDLAARRTGEAFRARAEASALAAVSRSVLSGEDTADALVARLRETFTLEAVALLEESGGHWRTLAAAGTGPAAAPAEAGTVLTVSDHRVLALSGRPLPASDRRVLDAFASQVGILLEQERLRAQAEQARVLEQADATRTALLAAVSHDLRTPLATIRASVDGLTSTDLHLDDTDRASLVETLGESTARLERLIDNLLDLSRLQTGTVRPALRATSLEEVVPLVVEEFGPDTVKLDVPESLPLVTTDPGLLERVVANLVSNAVRHSPAGSPVTVTAAALDDRVVVRVVDVGPGVPDELKERLFEPFQRLGDTSGAGLGLGLAVASGLAAAVGAEVVAEDTPGGGLTMIVTVPRAGRPS
jgi:two-component system sensor histidine kinase KdpD